MTDLIEGTVVAVTGASSGIGAATARLLAQRGAHVVVGARRTDRLDDLVADIREAGGQALSQALDVTDRADVEAFVGAAVEEFGRLDVLVNNAGISRIGPVGDLDVDGWSAMIDVNLRGVLNGIAAAMPVFRRQERGHFVTTVSTAGLKIVPTMAVYAATKNAVRTLMEGLRQESTDGVIRTTSISPGYVSTELASYIEDPATRRPGRRSAGPWMRSASPRTQWPPRSRSRSSSRRRSRSGTSPSGPRCRTERSPDRPPHQPPHLAAQPTSPHRTTPPHLPRDCGECGKLRRFPHPPQSRDRCEDQNGLLFAWNFADSGRGPNRRM